MITLIDSLGGQHRITTIRVDGGITFGNDVNGNPLITFTGGSTVTSWKQGVRAATTAAGTLATSFENGDVIDGVTLATGDRILIKNQASGAENGIYTVNASGAPTRVTDADTGDELVGATVIVTEGTTNADTVWINTTNAPITIGSTALVFSQLSAGGGGGSTWYVGTGAPSSGLGTDGDFYLQDNGVVWEKISGTWTASAVDLTGPTGATGAAGAAGSVWYTGSGVPSGGTGVNGDFYVQTNGDVYQKVAGSWVLQMSIIGPTGNPAPGVRYDGAGFVVQVGKRLWHKIKSGGTITGGIITADRVGSAVVDILTCSYAAWPGGLTSICGANKPTLSSALKNTLTLTGWTTGLVAGDMIEFQIVSADTITELEVQLDY